MGLDFGGWSAQYFSKDFFLHFQLDRKETSSTTYTVKKWISIASVEAVFAKRINITSKYRKSISYRWNNRHN